MHPSQVSMESCFEAMQKELFASTAVLLQSRVRGRLARRATAQRLFVVVHVQRLLRRVRAY